MAEKRNMPKSGKVGDATPPAAVFRALSDPHRLRILSLIAHADGEVCVCDLNDAVPLLQPTVSHHLKVLKDAGLVAGKRRAQWVYYRLADGANDRLRAAVAFVAPKGATHEDPSLSSERQARRKRLVLPHAARRRAAQAPR